VRFVLFTGEEQGLRGSAAYAAECKARGEDIRGVVNLDMIGFNTGDPVYDTYALSGSGPGASESRQLAEVFSDVVGIYGLDLLPHPIYTNTYPLVGGSDQWSFLSQGYPAILVIEDYAGHDFTPYYHSISDTLSTLNLDYYADLTRAAVATLAHLGRLLPGGHVSGTVRALDTSLPLSGATVAALTPVYSATFTALSGAGGVYSLPLPVGGYTLTVTSPGYYATTVTGVWVITDAVTVQDVALAPWPRWYLPFILKAAV
jgi:Zn-dependent M28 family amino/carboxypeptidase